MTLSTQFNRIRNADLPNIETHSCGICIENFNNNASIVAHAETVQHLFHKTCLNNWTTRRSPPCCPLCFREITKIDGVAVHPRINWAHMIMGSVFCLLGTMHLILGYERTLEIFGVPNNIKNLDDNKKALIAVGCCALASFSFFYRGLYPTEPRIHPEHENVLD